LRPLRRGDLIGNVELFNVLSRTFSRFSPLDVAACRPRGGAVSEQRTARSNYWPDCAPPALPERCAAFVLAALATVVFEGWS